jgi:xanthine dehydrogenase accessory factor
MSDDLLALAATLREREEPFALAVVVRCERPTSAKPGAKALIRADGTVTGWIGGACAEPIVVREAVAALRDGQPRFVSLVGESGRVAGRTEGIREHPMTCHSGGTLEIYVEPYLPKPLLLLVGHGPVVETLAALGRVVDYTVEAVGAGAGPDALDRLTFTPRTSVVVATHGEEDEDMLERVLAKGAGYVSLVASRKRAAAVLESLRQRGVPVERLGRLKAPAGLDIGAVTPTEIAVSILAEIIQLHRSEKWPAIDSSVPPSAALPLLTARPVTESWASDAGVSAVASPPEAVDPVCGMAVKVATARYRSEVGGRTVYFCCGGCKTKFDAAPDRYPPR